ncbi:uncharacterized protein LOC143030580 isoform X1 [Oratosquilla oratoria]|uniref:uncharacterized protein LOC143030580 isoform X1 n=1 Tax=Oratosquilla oratoria TaxID=337810 RepID=UPI003F761F89
MAHTRNSNSSKKLEDMVESLVKAREEDRQFLMQARKEDQQFLSELKEIVKQQRQEIQYLKSTVVNLQARVEDLEQYTRREDIIISGLKIVKTYSEAVKGDSDYSADNSGQNIVENQVIHSLSNKGIQIRDTEISACHTLGKRKQDGTQNVIMRFVSRKSKVNVLKNAKKLKGTGVYVNEHLTKRTGEIAKTARDMRKQGKIISTWTRDCKVYIKCKDEKVHQQVTVTQICALSNYRPVNNRPDLSPLT